MRHLIGAGATWRIPDDNRRLVEAEKILTRIGADRVEVPFSEGMCGPFGEAISRVSVPGHWHIEGLAEADGAEWRQDGAGRLILAGAGLVYDRFGLTRKDTSGESQE